MLLSYVCMTLSQRRASHGTVSNARVQLVEAAAKLVATGGVESATSRAITDAAGQNLGSITYYFGSKDSLISESIAMTARALMGPVVAELTDQVASPAQRLLKAVQIICWYYADPPRANERLAFAETPGTKRRHLVGERA